MMRLQLNDKDAIQKRALDMLRSKRMFREMAEYIEAMVHGNYELPSPIDTIEGVHKVVSTDAGDAVRAATRVLSSVFPGIKYWPISDNEAGKRRANEIEEVLRWWFKGLDGRGNAPVPRDIVRSAIMYDMVAFQTVFLPHEEEAQRSLRGLSDEDGEHRVKYIGRNGPFAWRLHNPKNVYPMYGNWGLEGVLLVKDVYAYEVVSDWGEHANEFMSMLKSGDTTNLGKTFAVSDPSVVSNTPEYTRVTIFDYMDTKYRCVWVNPHGVMSDEALIVQAGVPIMEPTEHGLDFIPWVCISGGTNLEDSSDHQYNPMLYAPYHTKQWETINITDTLVMTEAIRNFKRAQRKDEGPNPDGVYETTEDINTTLKVTPGHKSTMIEKPTLDQNLLVLSDRLASRMDKSTVSRILMGGDPSGNTSFSGLNLLTQTALGAIKPFKELAERAIKMGLEQMLLWVASGTEDIPAYGMNGRQQIVGSQHILSPTEIEPDAIYIDVKREEDAPTDRIQRVNAANQAKNFGYSNERALGDIGVTDPQEVIKESYTESIKETLVQVEINKIQARGQIEIEAMVAQAQQAMAQEQAAQQQAQAQAQAQAPAQAQEQFPGGGQFAQGNPNQDGSVGPYAIPGMEGMNFDPNRIPENVGPAGIPGVEGIAYDPSQGGLPPQTVDPNATREQQTGVDAEGLELI